MPPTASPSFRPYLPGALDDFVDLVVPELDRRGLRRAARDGETLRRRLGLERPAHRAPARRLLAVFGPGEDGRDAVHDARRPG
ncbi:hypothetical protein GA0115261_101401, partial [Streptomyces sp. OspMP-M43]